MSTTTLLAIVTAVRSDLAALSGITDTGRLFSPREAPTGLDHRSFALSFSTRNADDSRGDGRRQVRKRATIIIRVSHAINTLNEVDGGGTLGGLDEVLADVENMEAAIWASTTAPLNGSARVNVVTIAEPRPTAAREHYLTDITLDVAYYRDASTVTT